MMVTIDLSVHGQRSLNDLLNAERQMRAVSDQAVRDLRQLLLDIAVRLDGKRIEDIRHRDPSAPANWTVADWRAFVNSLPVSSDWKSVSSPTIVNDQRYTELIAEIKTLTAELEESRAKVADLERQICALKESVHLAVSPNGVSSAAPEVVPAGAIAPMSAMLADVRVMLETAYPKDGKSPDELTPYVGGRSGGDAQKHLKRIWLILYLIAAHGITSHFELKLLISEPFGSSMGGGGGQRTLISMRDAGLIDLLEHRAAEPETTQQAALLSEKGLNLYRKLFPHHPVVKGEIRRILDIAGDDSARVALISSFALQARRRGYYALVFPEVKDSGIQPDAWVGRGDESLYVFFVDGRDRVPMMERWEGLSRLNNGKVAIVAATQSVLERAVADCEVANRHGVAVNLESIITDSYANIVEGKNPLWTSTF